MKWLVHQIRLLRQQGLVNRLKAFLKKAARYIIRPVYKFMNSQHKLRRNLAIITKKLGLYSWLQPIYLRMSGLESPLNIASETKHSFVVSRSSISPIIPGTLTTDEILARIKKELAIQNKYK
jgi:hypothetical protein